MNAPRLLRSLALGLLAFLVCGAPARAQPPATQPARPFFFIQMTDVQFGMFAGDREWTKETELFEKAIAAANRLKPAFVVITGDLINKPGHPEQTKEFLRIAGQLDKSIPLRLVSGNHDVENSPTPQSLAIYRRDFGKDYYSFDHVGCHFIALNTTLMHKPQNAAKEDEEQMAWLKRNLATASAAKPRHIIALHHHPLFVSSPDEKDTYHSIPTARRGELIDLYRQHTVSWVFAGHLHRCATATGGGIQNIIAGPVGKPLGKDPSGFQIVKVYDGRIEHEYVGRDQAPAKVDLER